MSASLPNAICTTWSEISLDSRLLEAVKHLKWKAPTAVQGACIPLALKGRDMALQSRTGSGKTGAFLIPVLQHIITKKEQMCNRSTTRNPLALILLPSVELCEQTVEVANALATYVRPRIVVDNLTFRETITKARIASAPVLVATVALLGKHCRNGTVTAEDLKSLFCVVIDEADLVVSVAGSSLQAIQSVLPSSVQTILSSATLTEAVLSIKRQLLHNPVTITLNTGDEGPAVPIEAEDNIIVEARTTTRRGVSSEKLKHYYLVATDECHHHTLIYALYRLGHIKGKTLLFVNDEDNMYRLQNFFAQLGVDAVVYDLNLPLNVRIDTLHRFQTGAVGTLVCTDGTLDSVDLLQQSDAANEVKRVGRRARAANSAGTLQRGIDFADVRNVILFDGVQLPTTSAFSHYTHRVGRAGRAGKGGLAITLFSIQQARRVTRPLRNYLRSCNISFNPFKQLQRKEATKLQYRVDNVLASITRSSTRRQRVATVATELTRSAYLTSHMSQKDSAVLKGILLKSKKATKCDSALLDIPHYMRIEGADSTEHYRKRVRSSEPSANLYSRGTKKRSLDPLSRVATSIKAGSTRKRKI